MENITPNTSNNNKSRINCVSLTEETVIISKYESSHQSNRLDKSSRETNIDIRAFHAADDN